MFSKEQLSERLSLLMQKEVLSFDISKQILVDDNLNKLCDQNEILTSIDEFKITRLTMGCLRPKEWLNSDIVSSCFMLLKRRENTKSTLNSLRCHFCNTWFYQSLAGKGYKYDSCISRWTAKLGYSLFQCDKILVPIHRPTDFHWALAIADLGEKNLKYFDSFHWEDKEVLVNLARYLDDEAKCKSEPKINTINWPRLFPKDIPKQTDSYNCGIYVLHYANRSSVGAPFYITSSDINSLRREVVFQLLNKKVD